MYGSRESGRPRLVLLLLQVTESLVINNRNLIAMKDAIRFMMAAALEKRLL